MNTKTIELALQIHVLNFEYVFFKKTAHEIINDIKTVFLYFLR